MHFCVLAMISFKLKLIFGNMNVLKLLDAMRPLVQALPPHQACI